ncbi:MAG: alpha-glucan family phosphorylase [Flavobacterium sp.]|nr:MAG: alpha-glucan family phosphorylase [Flavobacterium sp.]
MNKTILGYTPDPQYHTSVAYFSMEFAIDQSLPIYSGGLGFLAGSHLRSAYELKQNLIGIGILWKYGYYDQCRNEDGTMRVEFNAKQHPFLEDTGIIFQVPIKNTLVNVKAFLLKPETFGSAPLYLLSTDLPENDDFGKSITNRLYDAHLKTKIAQSVLLGIGGGILLDQLGIVPDRYHLNEGHAIPLSFYLYTKFKDLREIKKRLVFTTHTPELAGNEEHHFELLKEMSFFYHLQVHEVMYIFGLQGNHFNYTLGALKCAGIANAVSKLHGEVANKMWNTNAGICEIIAITNAQNKSYWQDKTLAKLITKGDDEKLVLRKKEMKTHLFEEVEKQTGKRFDENVLTIVWARRFAGYKRADLLLFNWDKFISLISNSAYPVQIIWAGKPYPEDQQATAIFNQIVERTKPFHNCAVLTGHELNLSALLKKGADVWLNNPTMYREASGTSGMTAAMNGAINLSIPDGWVPEFAKDNVNCFVIKKAPDNLVIGEMNRQENDHLMDALVNRVLPTYYNENKKWIEMLKNGVNDVIPKFESGRMAKEYYEKMYNK